VPSASGEPLIHIVDDEESVRVALRRLLRHAGYAVETYASAGEFLVAELDDERHACVLLDLELQGPDGLALQQALRRRGDAIPIVFMSAYGDIPRSVRAIKSGASDFLEKPIEARTLLAAVESALSVAGAAAPPEAPTPLSIAGLSQREQVVLRGIVAGRLNKQLATDLGLSERTIKSCRAAVMRKFGARSLAELVRLASPHIKS
jgi:FixJ family two-component response regulator